MNLEQLMRLAKRLGYKGEADAAAVRSFLLGKIGDDDTFQIDGKRSKVNFTKDGEPVTRSALEAFDAGGGAAVATLDEDPAEKPKATPPDFASEIRKYVTASIEAEVRKLGAASNARPRLEGAGGGPDGGEKTPDIKVRSMAEVVYDINREKYKGVGGQPIFSSFENARAFQVELVQKLAPHADRVESTKRHTVAEGAKWSSEWMVKRGFAKSDEIDKRTYATSPVGSGGAYLGMSYAPDIIKNVNFWGAALAFPQLVIMDDAETTIFKTSGDLTVNYTTENSSNSSQKATPSNLKLTARTGIMATKASMQVLQDARIDLAMQVAEDFTRSLARHLERTLFIGNGDATYAGMKGLITRLTDIGYGTAAGLVLGGGTMAAHTDANVTAAFAKLPDWARAGAVIFCTPYAQDAIFSRLSRAGGGVTVAEISGVGRVPVYYGTRIVTTNAMPNVNGNGDAGTNQVDAIIGDLSRCVVRGSRLTTMIDADTSAGFLDYAVWWRCVDRHDLLVHDYGDATTVGGYVGLYQN